MPEPLPEDITALKRIIAEMARDAVTARAEIARLKFQLARYRRAEFGRSSEKLARETEQLELALEALETDQAERLIADRRRSRPDCGRGAEAGAASAPGTSVQRGSAAYRTVHLSQLRRRAAQD